MKLLASKGLAPGTADNGLQDQMRENEKLIEEMKKSWEQKLLEAESRRKQVRSEYFALISPRNPLLFCSFSQEESENSAMANVTQYPHILNLHEDMTLSECLVFGFKPGVTRLGRKDSAQKQDIILAGANIKKEHAVVENQDGVVTISACPGAKVFVNGDLVTAPCRLQHVSSCARGGGSCRLRS